MPPSSWNNIFLHIYLNVADDNFRRMGGGNCYQGYEDWHSAALTILIGLRKEDNYNQELIEKCWIELPDVIKDHCDDIAKLVDKTFERIRHSSFPGTETSLNKSANKETLMEIWDNVTPWRFVADLDDKGKIKNMRPSRRKKLMHARHDFKRMAQSEIDKRVNFSDRMILIIGQGGTPKSLK
jgi:hypothetical protein